MVEKWKSNNKDNHNITHIHIVSEVMLILIPSGIPRSDDFKHFFDLQRISDMVNRRMSDSGTTI